MGTGWTSPLRLLAICACVATLAGLGGCEWGEEPAPDDQSSWDPDGGIGDPDVPVDADIIVGKDDGLPELPDSGDPAAPLFTDAALSPDGQKVVFSFQGDG